jgi:hypothetical protein
MGVSFGVSPEQFRERSIARTPNGDVIVNPCIGCDSVHREYIADVLDRISRERAKQRSG